jgi:predicted RNA-binding protein with EMAP domain
MRGSLKIAAAGTVLLLALGAIVFVYANAQNTAVANAEQERTILQYMQTYAESNNNTLCKPDNGAMMGHMNSMRHMEQNKFQWSEQFLENATLSTVQGTVVSQVKGMLILNTDTGQVRILLPREWTVGNEVVNSATLFNGTFASAGQDVTIKVIQSTTFSNANFSLTVMMGYEAINATDTHAYAILPFNITPSS